MNSEFLFVVLNSLVISQQAAIEVRCSVVLQQHEHRIEIVRVQECEAVPIIEDTSSP